MHVIHFKRKANKLPYFGLKKEKMSQPDAQILVNKYLFLKTVFSQIKI